MSEPLDAGRRARQKDLSEKDRRFLWHPFTQMDEWLRAEPLIIERGEGAWLVDVEGKRYLDGVSSLWVTVHGHRKRAIDRAVKAQIDRVAHTTLLGLTNVPSIELAERLVAIAPRGLTRVFYSDSGSTAVEIALKIAFQYQQQRGEKSRTRFIHFTNAYHGDTLGLRSAGSIFPRDLPAALPGRARSGAHGRCPDGWTRRPAVESLAAPEGRYRHGARNRRGYRRAPDAGAAGMIPQPPGWLAEVRRLCTAHGVLLIADEVATGFGRTGTMFACEQEASPDLMCLAKDHGRIPAAGGHAGDGGDSAPSAVRGVQDLLPRTHHTGTCWPEPRRRESRPLRDGTTLERLRPKIRASRDDSARSPRFPTYGRAAAGFMVGIELSADVPAGAPYPIEKRVGHKVCMEARRRGAILRPLGDVVVLMPPLGIKPKELDALLDITRDSIRAVCGD
jgi:adenosylmethionine-8-amino-7-oxononanoate aminotransferase